MKTNIFAVSLALALACTSTVASAGCAKGAIVGGVAGHVAGHHGLLGAGAGCLIGNHMSKKKARQQAAQAQTAPQATTTRTK